MENNFLFQIKENCGCRKFIAILPKGYILSENEGLFRVSCSIEHCFFTVKYKNVRKPKLRKRIWVKEWIRCIIRKYKDKTSEYKDAYFPINKRA